MRKIDRSFVPTTREIKYLNKTFTQWRQSLIDYAKVYFPNSYTDFNEASPGMMFIEMTSYVGDVLGYYIDTQFRENLIQFAEEQDNIIAIAQALGYKPKPATASYTTANFYQLCPAAGADRNYEPDSRFFLRVAPNCVVASDDFPNFNFRTQTEINFADPQDREITVYAVNNQNQPITYLIRKAAKIVAGTITTYDVSFGDPQRFNRIVLPENNVLEVLSVRDSSNFTWSEVDYLAQDLILEARENTNLLVASGQSIPPNYTIRVKRTPRRFVTRYNQDYQLELHFGSGILDDTDSTINLEPKKISNDEYQTNLANTSLDPSDFLSSRSYGLAPGNIDMTIQYVVGGGVESNLPSNTINQIRTVEVSNDRNVFSPSEAALFDDIVASLAVNNPDPATGGKDADSIEEVRQNALAFFNAQNRLVNLHDYMARIYAMPPKFGGAAKAFVAQDTQINQLLLANTESVPEDGTFVVNDAGRNIVNIYVLGYDRNKKLAKLNAQVKKNLQTYLDQYRILTDELRILDAFPVNIGVNFKIVVFKNYNMNEVLVRCIDAIKNFFDIDRWQINQPIILTDLITELATVDGVQSVVNCEVVNKYRFRDGADYNDYYYDIPAATQDGVIYPSLDPCIFDLRYPETDIVGSAAQ
jgi:hypothetical protein